MPFKIKPNKKFNNLLKADGKDSLVAKTRKQFAKRGTKKIKQAMVQDMIRGVSPVHGKGKWKKYSQSYKDVIRNKAAFRKVGGKIVRFGEDVFDGLTIKEAKALRASKNAIKNLRNAKANRKQLIKDLNQDYHRAASPTKQVSPVNLRHTGGLHRSLRVVARGGFLRAFRIVIEFRNKLADIHDRRGAGKSKVIRRLLPTRRGERFNKRITDTAFNELKKSADTVAKEFSRQ